MGEDRPLELAQLVAGLDAELLHQLPARLPVDGESVRLAAALVEGLHQQRLRPLAQRVRRHQSLQLGDQLGVEAGGEVGLDPLLEGGDAELVQAHRLGVRERLVREIGEGRAAYELECLPQQLRLAAGLGGGTRLTQQLLEARRVDLLRIDAQQVAAGMGLDRVGSHELAQLGDVDLQGRARRHRRLRRPDGVDELIGRDDAVRLEEQHGQQAPLPLAGGRDRHSTPHDLEGTEDREPCSLRAHRHAEHF